MRTYWTLTRRELGGFFFSITGYVIIAAVTLLVGSSFVLLIRAQGNEPFLMPITELFFNTSLFWIILILTSAIITMKLYALEQSAGTFETLMTTPISDGQVVAAKFTGAILFYLMMWLPTLGCLLVVRQLTHQSGAVDAGAVGGMYLGIFLYGCLLLSFGCFASALTRSQTVAAMISLAFGVGLIILAYLAQQSPTHVTWGSQVLAYFDFFGQMRDFVRGILDTRTLVFCASVTFFFLFLTLRVLESRRWK